MRANRSPSENRIDQLSATFRRQWQGGRSPEIEAYLLQIDEPARPRLLRALLTVELELRRSAGEAGVECPRHVDTVAKERCPVGGCLRRPTRQAARDAPELCALADRVRADGGGGAGRVSG